MFLDKINAAVNCSIIIYTDSKELIVGNSLRSQMPGTVPQEIAWWNSTQNLIKYPSIRSTKTDLMMKKINSRSSRGTVSTGF